MDLPPPPVTLLHEASLFLDFDGTLTDIVPTPDAVRVSAGLVALLDRLHDRLDCRLALLSGRGARELAALVSPLRLMITGSHGQELLRPDGELEGRAPAPLPADAIAQMQALASAHPGVLIEEKPHGAAIHFRRAPAAEGACRAAAFTLADRTGLVVQPGKMVFELKPAGADKGRVLRDLMATPPFAGHAPVFAGDDLTDEHGFAAARALGGHGILVGPPRETAATHRIAGVDALLDWLTNAGAML